MRYCSNSWMSWRRCSVLGVQPLGSLVESLRALACDCNSRAIAIRTLSREYLESHRYFWRPRYSSSRLFPVLLLGLVVEGRSWVLPVSFFSRVMGLLAGLIHPYVDDLSSFPFSGSSLLDIHGAAMWTGVPSGTEYVSASASFEPMSKLVILAF